MIPKGRPLLWCHGIYARHLFARKDKMLQNEKPLTILEGRTQLEFLLLGTTRRPGARGKRGEEVVPRNARIQASLEPLLSQIRELTDSQGPFRILLGDLLDRHLNHNVREIGDRRSTSLEICREVFVDATLADRNRGCNRTCSPKTVDLRASR
jgi:hypothetical protein